MNESGESIPKLQSSPDGHFFQTETGEPFFLLADTAWLLFNKLKEDEARVLLENRAKKGFNVILAVVFRDLFTPNTPNAYGVTPFASEADMHAVKLNPEWMAYVERVVAMAGQLGLFIGLLPTWGDKWNEHSNSAGPVIMDREGARRYGRFLSDQLAERDNIIWILGGDSPIQHQGYADTVHAMAEGIRAGGSGERLMTFHPCHNAASDIFHAAPWMDFNVMQSGHARPNIADYLHIERMYGLQPAKPCLNLESNFEQCPMFIMNRQPSRPTVEPLFSDYDVRKSLYRSVLAGAAGFAYGCEPIRQLHRESDRIHVHGHWEMPTWREALDAPGSSQLRFLIDILEQRRYFTRVPAQELLLPCTRFRGVGMDFTIPRNEDPVGHVRVARCRAGSYILAYCPVKQVVMLDTSGLAGRGLRVSIHNPETGAVISRQECVNEGVFTAVPPRDLDTLFVLDAVEESAEG